jgi:hypothetical protein
MKTFDIVNSKVINEGRGTYNVTLYLRRKVGALGSDKSQEHIRLSFSRSRREVLVETDR